jgi:hypothetical protein
MARHLTITDNLDTIQITVTQDYPVPGATATDNINKGQIIDFTIVGTNVVCIITTNKNRPFIYIDWHDVTSPVVTSALDLYNQLMGLWLSQLLISDILSHTAITFTETIPAGYSIEEISLIPASSGTWSSTATFTVTDITSSPNAVVTTTTISTATDGLITTGYVPSNIALPYNVTVTVNALSAGDTVLFNLILKKIT